MMKAAIYVASLVLLTGCATQWHNSNFSDPNDIQRQKTIDEGYCTQVAHGSAPMPETRIYSPAQQSYQINGSITTDGPSGFHTSRYSGTATPTPSAAFSSGLAQGAALGTLIRARRAQDTIMKGCMAKLGWSDTAIPPTPSSSSGTLSQPPAPENAAQSHDIPMPKHQPAYFSCHIWTEDIAASIDSGYAHGVGKDVISRIAQDYISNTEASDRDGLIFKYIIDARYKISSDELSSEDFLRYVRWECEQDWAGIGLGTR